MRTSGNLLRWVCLLSVSLSSVAKAAEYPFYAFQNGVRKSTHEARAALLSELGYDGIGSAKLPAAGETESFFSTYERKGLKVFSFYSGVTIKEDEITIAPALVRSLPELKGRDVVIELFVKGNRETDRDADLVPVIQRLAGLADKSGANIVLYPHTNMYVEIFADATRLAEKVDRDNVGVMFNLCHFLRVQPTADLKRELESAGALLRQVSVSGADRDGEGWPSLIQPLGRGTYDVSSFLAVLREVGFQGPVGLQCFNIKGEPRVFLAESIKAWRSMK